MRSYEPSSRLSRRIDSQNRKAFVFGLLGILIIGFLLLEFGIPLLTRLAVMLSGNQDTTSEEAETVSYIPPPVLTNTFDATNSAEITVQGSGKTKTKIRLYVNGEVHGEVTSDETGLFTFEGVSLTEGTNEIKAKTIIDKKQSELSNPITITLIKKTPELSINSPSDKQSFGKDDNRIPVSGKTNVDAKVTVNGFWAIVDNEGTFSYTLTLQNGENKIKIIAEDIAGNKTEKEISVTYNP